MSNSQNDGLEDVSKGNNESAGENTDSTSNKKTRFTKSKSISEVFKELDSQETNDSILDSEDAASELESEDKYSNIENYLSEAESEEEILDASSEAESLDASSDVEFEEDIIIDSTAEEEIDEIIPIHNEYKDLDESEAFNTESIDEEEISESSELDNYVESIVNEKDDLSSDELVDSKENLDAVGGDEGSMSVKDIENASFEAEDTSLDAEDYEDDSIDSEDIDQSYEEELLDENMKVIKVNNASSEDVLSKKNKGFLSSFGSIKMDSSFIITVLSFIVGLGILIMGIFYLNSSSDRVVDNVLSGETAGLAVFLIIIGLLIIGFSILRFLSSTKADQSSSMLDMFKSIRDIDYDDVKDDNISRDDFDSVFSSVFGKEKRSDFSNDDGDKSSVDKNLFDEDDEISDEDIDALYSDSNLNKTASSTKNSTGIQDTDNIIEEDLDDDFDMIDSDNSEDFDNDTDLEDDNVSDLKDKYSKYNFDDDDAPSKPQFKKSVDISKFDDDGLSEEELEAERRRKAEELEEKKRRIIQGTNFDNSLRK
ncbi:hypothetical protein mru_0172 [Methanobrevibacter ruminantium M1]|uniref:Uncharacterized protein n=1 Tax=Methanobrevibacter ruminantium (strain ATCC 35063 / DSM 1093 / JCM 13430 / OCM 146 / M1) TaxID=634498 RepID=D3DYV4_METRM|nr:hypothetical protein [Methanobrevibacter ruminantium]ADC46024.1 hypothetical protein mru_0172 [Methanobrevibacter ruminantium M1]